MSDLVRTVVNWDICWANLIKYQSDVRQKYFEPINNRKDVLH